MKRTLLLLLFLTSQIDVYSQQDSLLSKSQQESNKKIARNFYQDLWFTNNTDRYKDYVANEYVIHDIFERKEYCGYVLGKWRIEWQN